MPADAAISIIASNRWQLPENHIPRREESALNFLQQRKTMMPGTQYLSLVTGVSMLESGRRSPGWGGHSGEADRRSGAAEAVGGLHGGFVAALRRPWLVAVARCARGDRGGGGRAAPPLPGGGSAGGGAEETIRQVGAPYTLGHSPCFWVTRPTQLSGHVGHERRGSDPNVGRVTPKPATPTAARPWPARTPPCGPTALSQAAPPCSWPASAASSSNKPRTGESGNGGAM